MSSSRKCAGRLFQTRGPATAKLLSPNVLWVRGTAHDLSVDERSRRRGPSETKMSSARYEGAWPDNEEEHTCSSLSKTPPQILSYRILPPDTNGRAPQAGIRYTYPAEGWKAEFTWEVGYISTWLTCQQTVTHPSINRVRGVDYVDRSQRTNHYTTPRHVTDRHTDRRTDGRTECNHNTVSFVRTS